MESTGNDTGTKKGCVVFIIVILVLAVGAGISVVIKGKSMKPKSRALVVAKSKKTLEQIRGEFTAEVTESTKQKFEAAYGLIVEKMETPGEANQDKLMDVAAELDRIRADRKVTQKEASEWAKLANRTMGTDNR